MSFRAITEAEELNIVSYYLAPHTLANTAKVFHRHTPFIISILTKHQIETRADSEEKKLTQKMRKKTCLEKYSYMPGQFGSPEHQKAINEKYGVDNVFQAEEIKEKIKQTNLVKYGVEYISQNKEIKERVAKTCLERYGATSYLASEENKLFLSEHHAEILEKKKANCLEAYGVEFSFQRQDVKEKVIQSWINNWGVEHISKSEIIREKKIDTWAAKSDEEILEYIKKRKATNLLKYGVENPIKLPEIREKVMHTNLIRYGIDIPSKLPEIVNKAKLTCQERYGVDWYMQLTEAHARVRQTCLEKYGTISVRPKKWMYNNIYFDSFPELAFYIYHSINHIEIQREPVIFNYMYNDKIYSYIPDFSVEGQLVELKGDHLVKEGLWINPYDQSLNDRARAKQKCAIDNNVKILYSADYKFFEDWLRSNFDVEQFKCK